MLPPPAWGGAMCTSCMPAPGHAHRPAERLDRNADAGAELGRVALGEVEVPDHGLGELARRQQPEAGDDAGEAPVGQLEVEDLDRQRVARPRALDRDRPGERVDRREVDGQQVGGDRRAA